MQYSTSISRSVPAVVLSTLSIIFVMINLYQIITGLSDSLWMVVSLLGLLGQLVFLSANITLLIAILRWSYRKLVLPCILYTIGCVINIIYLVTTSVLFIIPLASYGITIAFRIACIIILIMLAVDIKHGFKHLTRDIVILAIYSLAVIGSNLFSMIKIDIDLYLPYFSLLELIKNNLLFYFLPSFLNVAFIMLIISWNHRRWLKKNYTIDQNTNNQNSDGSQQDGQSSIEQLEILKNLHDQGILTNKEYSIKKKEILDKI